MTLIGWVQIQEISKVNYMYNILSGVVQVSYLVSTRVSRNWENLDFNTALHNIEIKFSDCQQVNTNLVIRPNEYDNN